MTASAGTAIIRASLKNVMYCFIGSPAACYRIRTSCIASPGFMLLFALVGGLCSTWARHTLLRGMSTPSRPPEREGMPQLANFSSYLLRDEELEKSQPGHSRLEHELARSELLRYVELPFIAPKLHLLRTSWSSFQIMAQHHSWPRMQSCYKGPHVFGVSISSRGNDAECRSWRV
ncbi:hypothetical protein EKO04_011407 [Ascochyta lentis]|uniref:Uncharacterized protein n=1 Tax=Ascochyta lentis TaxID=205686 RepID=A0A8H7MBD2_9PLEO|nr:hypothetical protein EKO04_011407 [Ascochyta lentis]